MSKQSIEDYLSDHAFFSGMDSSYLKFLSDSAIEHRIKAGDVLFQYGKNADKFYLLQKGQVAIQVPALMGPALDIQTLGDDQILGYSHFHHGDGRSNPIRHLDISLQRVPP